LKTDATLVSAVVLNKRRRGLGKGRLGQAKVGEQKGKREKLVKKGKE